MMQRSRGPEVKADPVFSLPSPYRTILNLMTNYTGPKRKKAPDIQFNLNIVNSYLKLCLLIGFMVKTHNKIQ